MKNFVKGLVIVVVLLLVVSLRSVAVEVDNDMCHIVKLAAEDRHAELEQNSDVRFVAIYKVKEGQYEVHYKTTDDVRYSRTATVEYFNKWDYYKDMALRRGVFTR